jgi:release factor glutamine methyltransferase
VEKALSLPLPAEAVVVDLGTGSGAVALALAREKPEWLVVAIDNSLAALAVARQNAERNSLANCRFVLSDWLTACADHVFDLVVANPPYIAADDPELQSQVARYEPCSALVAGDAGLAAYRAIAGQAAKCLKPNGYLVVEHGWQQADRVAEVFAAARFRHPVCVKDLGGRPRVSSAVRAPD